MRKLKADVALKLLYKDTIQTEEDLLLDKNRWVLHCINVGIAAGRIAKKLNLDDDYATALGLVHDIGRKVNHPTHVEDGYKYMIDNGYPDEAIICITHSFIDDNIDLSAGGPPDNPDRYMYFKTLLEQHELTLYDSIIQLCDLFCSEKGFTTLEARLLDLAHRKGIYEGTLEHFNSSLSLKERIEQQMGCSFYQLFPEINPDDIERIPEDKEAVLKMVEEFNAPTHKLKPTNQ